MTWTVKFLIFSLSSAERSSWNHCGPYPLVGVCLPLEYDCGLGQRKGSLLTANFFFSIDCRGFISIF